MASASRSVIVASLRQRRQFVSQSKSSPPCARSARGCWSERGASTARKSIACIRVMTILWDAERVNVLRYWILARAKFYKSRGPRRTSIMRLASATISSVLLFSRLTGLFGHGVVERGEKIDALHPFPTGQTSILYPLYSITVIREPIGV